MRRVVPAAVATLAALVAYVSPAAAITGGSPDGNRHPEVGALLAQQDMAVVVLDTAVKGITPARLPKAGRSTGSTATRRSRPSATAPRR